MGRTGTYIAIDRLARACDERVEDISVRGVVRYLRTCPNHMVQTMVQYRFIYESIVNYMEKRYRAARRVRVGF